jgi:hypothetical protein
MRTRRGSFTHFDAIGAKHRRESKHSRQQRGLQKSLDRLEELTASYRSEPERAVVADLHSFFLLTLEMERLETSLNRSIELGG